VLARASFRAQPRCGYNRYSGFVIPFGAKSHADSRLDSRRCRVDSRLWDELEEEDFALPANKPLTLAAYEAGPDWVAYVDPAAVGDILPDMPLFLRPGFYVPAPLEVTYQTTWKVFPAPLKRLLEDPNAQLPE
jgi:hypothetical protein